MAKFTNRKLTKLEQAVVRQMGYPKRTLNGIAKEEYLLSNLSSCSKYGADAGFSGFIYYSDTEEFYLKNKKIILEFARQQAWEIGYGSTVEMVSQFNALRRDDVSRYDVEQVLFFNDKDNENWTAITNIMAWYALEEVSRIVSEEIEGY